MASKPIPKTKVKVVKRIVETDTDEMDATPHHRRSVCCGIRDTIRISVSVWHTILVELFDTFKWFLTLIMLYVFVSYVVRLPIFFLAFIHPLYAYSWIGLWITVMVVFLAWREAEHTKAQKSPKWVTNPNAIAEYLFLIEQSSKD